MIDVPTHSKGHTLDLIITNTPDRVSDICVDGSLFHYSDHFPISLSICALLPKLKVVSSPQRCLNFSKADYEGMVDFLLDWDFSVCLDSSDVDVIWSHIQFAIRSAIHKFVPLCTTTRRFSHLPKWFNSELRHNINCHRTLVRKYRSNPTPYLSDKVSQSRIQLDRATADTKSLFITNLVSQGGRSGIFSYISSLKKGDQLPPCVYLNSLSATTDADKADLFNSYFHSVYSPASTCHTPPDIFVSPNITEVQISIHDTFKVLTELDPSKSMGTDGIGPALLKHCATPLCTPLCHLFSVSLHTARIPSDWKVHKITPVFKSGNKNSVQNYRPISLLSSVSKVLEKLIYDKVLDFLYPSFSTFNSAKSTYLCFTNSKTPTAVDLFLDGQTISKSHSHKDLGVIISDDLTWSSHYTYLVSKALKTLGLVKRSVGSSATAQVRKSLYLILIRSQLSYCSPIWRPHLHKDIMLLESVQRKATKWILNDYKLDYRSRLSSLQLLPLMMSFEIADIVFFLSSLKAPSPAFDISHYVHFSTSHTRSSGLKLQHRLSHNNLSRHYYFNRLPRLWNRLPSSLDLLSCSIPLAKSRLANFMWLSFENHFHCSNICTYHFNLSL